MKASHGSELDHLQSAMQTPKILTIIGARPQFIKAGGASRPRNETRSYRVARSASVAVPAPVARPAI